MEVHSLICDYWILVAAIRFQTEDCQEANIIYQQGS